MATAFLEKAKYFEGCGARDFRMEEEGGACVLSDVHVGCTASNDGNVLSTFVLRRVGSDEKEMASITMDEDGDPILTRRTRGDSKDCLTLEHSLATPLATVGLQIWRGCLLMVDYIAHNEHRFSQRNVLELGCGVGLVSLVVGKVARQVLATDIAFVLELCQRNVHRNADFLGSSGASTVHVRKLDWLVDPGDVPLTSEPFSWTVEERQSLKNLDFILAADVIYDIELVDALFRWLHYLLSVNRSVVILISLEKRINFSLAALQPVSTAYDHFRECVQQLVDCNCPMHDEDCFSVQRVSTDTLPLSIEYERCPQLELWELTTVTVEQVKQQSQHSQQ